MRIVIDGRYINDRFPGIGRYTYNLVQALGKLNTQDEFLVLINSKLKNSRFDLRFVSEQPCLSLVDCHVPRFLPAEMLLLPIVIHRLNPSVFHSPFFLRPYPLSCPCVITLHDLIPLRSFNNTDSAFNRMIFWFGAKLACHLSSAILTPSVSSAKSIQKWCKSLDNRLHIIPLAADPLIQRPSKFIVDRMRRKFDLHKPYVLYVGSHLPHKNLESLVLAWSRIMSSTHRDNYRYQLVLAGREFLGYPKIRNLVEQLGLKTSVRFLGEVGEDKLPALYSGADLFVFPSIIEGYGLPVIEAMACGTPVICSNACSLPEVADGAAWMIEPDNIDSLANAMDQLIHSPDLREKFAQRGLARCAQLTWDATAQATHLVYQKVKGDA